VELWAEGGQLDPGVDQSPLGGEREMTVVPDPSGVPPEDLGADRGAVGRGDLPTPHGHPPVDLTGHVKSVVIATATSSRKD
jgi:hypothetical protein